MEPSATMALSATVHHVELALSDVDRSVYETLDFRLARHPSESARYLVTRLLAYALSYEEGIAFSKAGIAAADEPPVAVRDRTGVLQVWIDVGAPSAERLHKASKQAGRVILYTSLEPKMLQKEAATREIHKVDDIEVWRFEPSFLDELETLLTRTVRLEIARNDGKIYVTCDGRVIEGEAVSVPLRVRE
jgi:uncharacterized protein YaeQ